MEIQISEENKVADFSIDLLRELAFYALSFEKMPDKTELSIALVGK